MRDEACDVPKPLIVAIEELGEIAHATIKILRQFGAEGGTTFPGRCHHQHRRQQQQRQYC